MPLWFLLPDVVMATDAMPHHETLFSGFWASCILLWHLFCLYVQSAHCLARLQVVALKLLKVAFRLSGKVVALYLDNSIAKAYLWKQGGTAFLFLSRLVCCI